MIVWYRTKEAAVLVDKVDGERVVDMQVDRLLLLVLGNCDVIDECTNDSVTHSYDRRNRALRFDVKPAVAHETFGGLDSLDGRWSIG